MVTLVGEKVDIYLMKDMNKDDWTFLGTDVTDRAGRVCHTVLERLTCGIYPVKMIVRFVFLKFKLILNKNSIFNFSN